MSAPRALSVVVVANRYLEQIGGAEAVARVGVEELRRRGHRVEVVSLVEPSGVPSDAGGRCSDAGVHRLRPDNLYHPHDAHRWPWPARALWHLRDLTAKRNARQVEAILRVAHADVMLSHNLKGLGLRTAEAPRRAGVAHVHVLHDLQLCVPSGVLSFGREQAGDAAPRLRAWHARQASARLGSPALVVSPSRFLLDEHRRAGFFPHSRTAVLPLPRPKAAASPPPSGVLRVVFAGQLAAHKGVRVLLAAWRLRTGAAELHVAGDGELRAEVEAAAATDPSLRAHGRLTAADLHALYASADVVVVPSLCYEGAGLVACEAQAHGAFVIASALGGLPEYVGGDGGALIQPDDAAALAAAIDAAGHGRDGLRRRRPSLAASARGLTFDAYGAHLHDLLADVVGRVVGHAGSHSGL